MNSGVDRCLEAFAVRLLVVEHEAYAWRTWLEGDGPVLRQARDLRRGLVTGSGRVAGAPARAGRLEDDHPVPEGGMDVRGRAAIEQHAVFAFAARHEVIRGLVGRRPVGVVDEHDAVVGEVGLRSAQALELVLVGMVAVVEVDPDRPLAVDIGEVVAIVHLVELVRGPPEALEALHEGVSGPAELGEVVDPHAFLAGVADHAREEAEADPDPDVDEGGVG